MKHKEIKTLTRAGLADAIVNEFRVTKFNASEIVEDVLDEIAAALIDGNNVKISNFGTFKIKQKGERVGRNPKTLTSAIIAPRKSLSFKPSSVFKKIVNNK